MDVHLTSVFGQPLDLWLHDDSLPVVIGRGELADIALSDHWVSRVHCLLSAKDGRLFVRDLDSKHGTYINENRVVSAELHAGDRLELGLTTLSVELECSDSAIAC